MVRHEHRGPTRRRRRSLFIAASVLVLLLAGDASAADPSFAPSRVAGVNGSAAQVIDANRDGAPDLVVARPDSNDVAVLLGSGKGGFAAGPSAKVGDGPVAIASADFNNDGKADLAVANYTSLNVTVLLGDGMGGFSAASGSPIAIGGNPGQLTAADVSGDGHVDLVVPAYVKQEWQITVLLGDGSGRFGPAAGSPVARRKRLGVVRAAVGDLNRDGRPDLAIANSEAKGIELLFGKGGGGFGAATTVSTKILVGSIAAADLNRDGKLDLVFSSAYSNAVGVLLGRGAGLFRPSSGSPIFVIGAPHTVATGDFNEDGKPDLAVTNDGLGTVSVLLGNGAGKFRQSAFSPSPASPLVYGRLTLAGAADLNGDGHLDLVTLTPQGITILFRTPAAPSARPTRMRATVVLAAAGRIETLAADANRAAVVTTPRRHCARIVVWAAPGHRVTNFKLGFLGCGGDGVGELAVGGGQVAWTEEGGGNNLELTVMAAKLRGGPAKQIEYESNGDRAGGDPTGDWVGRLFGSGSLLAYNSWGQVCDRPPDTVCGENDPGLRVTGEQLVRIASGRRVVVARGHKAYPLAAVGGGRLAVWNAEGVTIFAPDGAPLATVPDAAEGARAVALSRATLAIERTFTLELYDPRTGAALRSIPLGPEASLQLVGVTSRLALLRGPRRLVLVRLSDGKLVSLQSRAVSSLVGVRLTEAGLFYAYNVRRRMKPGRIGFESTRRLLAGF